MLVAGHADDFKREHFNRQQSFRLVGEQEVAIPALQFHFEVGVFKLRIDVGGRGHCEFQIETGIANEGGKKLRDPLSVIFHRVLDIGHACSFPALGFGVYDDRNQRTVFRELIDEQLLDDADQVAGKPI